jgi:hypothetical protein
MEELNGRKHFRPNPEKDRAWRQANAIRIREYIREWRLRNRDKVNRQSRENRAKNPDVHRKSNADWRARNLERHRKMMREYMTTRIKSDPLFRAINNLRRRVRALLVGNAPKSAATMRLVGCDRDSLKSHLENKFREPMTWENYGSVWHIDHIRPCASFDLTDEKAQQECFHFSNLQPLLARDNLSKGHRMS